MAKQIAKTQNRERGMALLLTMFALLLLSAIGLFMVLSSDTETRIDANYGANLKAYYAARSGLEEVRDRVRYPSTTAGGLADLLPQDIAGNTGGVLYIVNPASGETVDPTNSSSPYFDDQLCHDYNSHIDKGIRCKVIPTATNWLLSSQLSQAPSTGPLGYKWVRINMKTNRIADPYFVDQTGASASLDTRVCWDGQTEQLSPGGLNPECDANGMQTVYMLTSLAATPQAHGPNGARKLLRAEVVAPAIRPPGALTMGASSVAPVFASGTGIPSVSIDGRVHELDGTLTTTNGCSAISPLAIDTPSGTVQAEQALNQLRLSIVQTANNSCKANGSGLNGNLCTPGLWWVRGTDTDPRFSAGDSSGSDSSSLNTGSPANSQGSMTGTPIGGHLEGGGLGSTACDPSDPSCFTNLNLAAPELLAIAAAPGQHVPVMTLPPNATAPFIGNRGNQADATIYQTAVSQIVQNEIAAINNLVATSVNKPNYFSVSSGNLASSYGTSTDPAVVVITDPTLSLQNGAALSGFGTLVIPSGLEIGNGSLQWTGIVLVKTASGHVTLSQGASGSINGALLVQPGVAVNIQNNLGQFRLTYSCEALDLPFSAQPMKTISTAETNF